MLKKCQGGKKVNGYWYFNQMLQCFTVNGIVNCHVENEQNVPAHALEYLARVNDTLLYPGAWCAMGDNVYMYGRMASSGNESMNNANKAARARYGVDAVVATMILLKLAVTGYNNKKAVAWTELRQIILTRKGMEKRDECFRNIHLHNYQYEVQETNDRWIQ